MNLSVLCLYQCTVEFPSEAEDAFDPRLYESTAQMLKKSAEKETETAEKLDDEVKFNSKKRKANSAPNKKEKVLVSLVSSCHYFQQVFQPILSPFTLLNLRFGFSWPVCAFKITFT